MSSVPPYASSQQDWQRIVSGAVNPSLAKIQESKSLKADYGALFDGATDDAPAWTPKSGGY